MKKIRFGIVEILGYIGMLTWIAVIFLRGNALSTNPACQFLLGILPNMGAAWVMTMFGKWMILFVLKKNITIKTHLFLCAGVFALALISEIIHDTYMNSPFDIYDIIVTAVAQLVIFFVPVLIKDKYFSSYA